MSLASFGVRRPVVANLVMFAVLGAGLVFGLTLRREFFPEIRPDVIRVGAPYPGAAPEEVERSLTVKIENAIKDKTDLIKEVTSTSTEGAAGVTIELREGVNTEDALQEIKRRIDALEDLPDAAEEIIVDKVEPNLPVVSVALLASDGATERDLKAAIKEVRDDLERLPGMGTVSLSGIREDELIVEVRPTALIEHGLSLPAIADAIGASLLELPGGSVRSATLDYALRGLGVGRTPEEIAQVVVRALPSGELIRVGDVAEVRLGFVDVDLVSRLNGRPAVSATVFKEGDQDIIHMAEMIRAYVDGRNGVPLDLTLLERLPHVPGVLRGGEAYAWPPMSDRERAHAAGVRRSAQSPLPGTLMWTTDLSRIIEGRLSLLARNALQGGALVFISLLLLLHWRVSFWVAAGLVVSLSGTLVAMRLAGVSLNLLTSFGLIIVLGILVDDAIVVAENIVSMHERGLPAEEAAIEGTNRVAWPVVATVLTTICAFLPLGLVEGQIGDFMRVLPIVTACALSVSLIESLFILPSHMRHSLVSMDRARTARSAGMGSWFGRLETATDAGRRWLFDGLIGPAYVRTMRLALPMRYLVTGASVAAVILSLGLAARVGFILFEDEDAETISVELRMPVGTPMEETARALGQIERAALARLDSPERPGEIRTAFTLVGSISSLDGTGSSSTGGNTGQIILELRQVEYREDNGLLKSPDLIDALREEAGAIPGAESLRIDAASGGPGGAAITFTIVGDDPASIDRAVADVRRMLAGFPEIVDISDNAERGRRELTVELLDAAPTMAGPAGFTRRDLNRQVQAFAFGIEAFSFAGDREDIDVRVRLPEEVRTSLAAIESMHVTMPGGAMTPLGEVAAVTERDGNAAVRRFNGQRAVTVTADVAGRRGNPEAIVAELAGDLRAIEAEHDVRILQRGRQEDFADAFRTFPIGLAAALGMIFVVLAWLFESYSQPLVVMLAIPFAIVGMVLGHWAFGYRMTFLSLLGFIALAGIVVNDSLILMEFVNKERRRGASLAAAVLRAGRARIRAILLTTITTVLGLMPLLLERSFQARFLVPMALTIACGLISATVVILVVLPCMLLILDDIGWLARGLLTGRFTPRESVRALMSRAGVSTPTAE